MNTKDNVDVNEQADLFLISQELKKKVNDLLLTYVAVINISGVI